jgi:predicted nucleic acid binding AN1-type Zn finger protein
MNVDGERQTSNSFPGPAVEMVDNQELQNLRQSPDASAGVETPQTPPISFMDSRVQELMDALHWRRTSHHDADTLILLDCGYIPEDRRSITMQEHFSSFLLVRSKEIEKLQSPLFKRYMGPMNQSRMFKKYPRHLYPTTTRFIVDLTPKTEGEDAIMYLMDLSCPRGVLNWYQSRSRWSVSAALVDGKDEYSNTSPPDPQQDYSPIRHLMAIERFMMAIEGNDPKFDSAPKLFTTVMVTKQFQIQGYHPLTDWAVRWLCADPNSRFLEALPETTLKIADVLQCESLCKDAFGILVGEAAFDNVVRIHDPHLIEPNKTAFGRQRDDVSEIWQTRIEYARNSFVDRIQKSFHDLVGEEMDWIEKLDTCREILRYQLEGIRYPEYIAFIQVLKDFVRGAIYQVLISDYEKLHMEWEDSKPGGEGLYPRHAIENTWPKLVPSQRIFTRFFWKLLQDANFYHNYSPRSKNVDNFASNFRTIGVNPGCAEILNTNILKEVRVADVNKAMACCYARGSGHFHLPSNQKGASDAGQLENVPQKDTDSLHLIKPCCYFTCTRVVASWKATSRCSYCGEFYCSDHRKTLNHSCHNRPQSVDILIGLDQPSLAFASDEVHDELDFGLGYRTFSSEAGSSGLHCFSDVSVFLFRMAKQVLGGVPGANIGGMVERNLTDTLMCLNEKELRYLPLWAGGYDDGTGGVFGSFVPSAPEGSDLGPGGDLMRSEDNDYELVDGLSTVNTSTVVNDGYSDFIPRKAVVSTDEVESVGNWSYIRDELDNSKRIQDDDNDSDGDLTIGALEADEHLNPQLQPSEKNKGPATQKQDDDDCLDEVFMENAENEALDFEMQSDSDGDWDQVDEEDAPSASGLKGKTKTTQDDLHVRQQRITTHSSAPTNQAEPAYTKDIYIYREEPEDYLMTRP